MKKTITEREALQITISLFKDLHAEHEKLKGEKSMRRAPPIVLRAMRGRIDMLKSEIAFRQVNPDMLNTPLREVVFKAMKEELQQFEDALKILSQDREPTEKEFMDVLK